MTPPASRVPRFSRPAKFLMGLGGALLLYTVAGFFIAPAIVKSQMLKRLPALFQRPVGVAEVSINPFTATATIRGLSVKEKNDAPFAGWDELSVRLKFSSFFRRGWDFQEISLHHPFAQITRGHDGKLNFADIIAALARPTGPPSPPHKTALPMIMFDRFQVDGATLSVDDFFPTTPVHTKLRSGHVKLEEFSSSGGRRNPYAFTASSDSGEEFQWSGAFSLAPLQVSGGFKIIGLDLKKYSPYLRRFIATEITDGRLDAGADYTASFDTNLELSLTNGLALLKSLSVKSSATGEQVAAIPVLSVALAEAGLGKKLIHITSLQSSGGSLLVRQYKDGTINLLSLLDSPNSPVPAHPPPASVPWTVSVDNLSLDSYTAIVEDQKPPQAARLSFNDINVTAKGFSTVSHAPIVTDVSLRLNPSGLLTARGTVALQPPSADLAVELVGLDLRPFQPYLEQHVKLALAGGLLSARGHARYSSEKGAPLAAFAGDVGLTNLATTDLVHFKDFVKMDALALGGINFSCQPNHLDVREVQLAGLQTTVLLDAGDQLNLRSVLPRSAPVSSPKAGAPAANFPLTIGSVIIDNASLHFDDQSIEPHCLFDIQKLDGTINGLSSRPDALTTVNLHGDVDQVSSFSVSGSGDPLSTNLSFNLAIACTNTDLTAFTPYMEKFGGYPLQRGKLLMALRIGVTRRKLVASDHVVISGLTLGPKNNSPDATSLPVKLGVALLKDRGGTITLDVPLSGSLDSPDMRLGPVIGQILGNILAKAATSPFTLLGALLGGGEELSYVDFSPGRSDLAPSEQAKIDKLAQALYQRPALQLEISPTADPAADAPVLARQKIEDQIRSLRAGELIAAGAPAESVQSVALAPADHDRLLQSLYRAALGGHAHNQSAPAEPPTLAIFSTNAPGVRPLQASLPPEALLRDGLFVKAGELMMWMTAPDDGIFNTPPSPISRALPHPIGDTSALTPIPVADATPAQMEAGLAAAIRITPDDLRALMQARARHVQAALLQSGQIEPERLFILSPKPMDLSAQGRARVNLSLD